MITYHFILEVNNKKQVQAHIKALDDDKFEPRDPEGVLKYRTLTKDIIPLVEAAKLPQTDPSKIKPDQIQKLGKLLFESLFTGAVLSSFWDIYELVRNENRSKPDSAALSLELRIAEEVLPEIAALPWEFMYARKTKGGNLWIADAPDIRFSRGRLRERSVPPIILKLGEPITIALVVADFDINKLKSTGVDLGLVIYEPILERLKKLADDSDGLIKLIEPTIRAADLNKIDKLLKEEHPHIFHFVGHGRFDPYNNLSGQIALVDGAGFPNWVSGEEFSNIFNRYRPAVVLLQACEGAASSAAQAYTGVASQILDQGIQVVAAMQYEITNNTAMVFCHEFYTHLANKRFSIDQAVQEGRNKIATMLNLHNTPEFATPVLFTNSGSQNLFTTRAQVDPRKRKEEPQEQIQGDFSFSRRPQAKTLNHPNDIYDINDILLKDTFYFGNIPIKEVAVLLRPTKGVWKPGDIAWQYLPEIFNLNQFWIDVERQNNIEEHFNSSDQQVGKHIRLTSVGLNRYPNPTQLELVWQKISWEQSKKTNGRVSDRRQQPYTYNGSPIWRWFREEDLIPPPLETEEDRCDPLLANRLAINLAVILKTNTGIEYAIIQKRSGYVNFNPKGIECGISESIHGDCGWNEEEKDVIDGKPDILRTAKRCLWQELGIAEEKSTNSSLPGFKYDVFFTALILNKRELHPRLVGFIIVNGEIEMFKESNISSLDPRVSVIHKEFGERKSSDVIKWDSIRWVEATPEGLCWILKQSNLSPEDRIRLIFYLSYTYGEEKAIGLFNHSYNLNNKPDWWD